MNLFIIPSWYPYPTEPLPGIFTREQAEAIAELSPDIRVIVSLWGHNQGYLLARRPWLWPKNVLWRLRQPRNKITKRNGLHEIYNAKLTWSRQLPFGGIPQLISVNRQNFLLAKKKFGHIDLMHAHVSYPAGCIAAALASEFNVPYVLTEHMSPFPFLNLVKDGKPLPEVTQAFTQAAATVAVSPSLAKRVASFGYPQPHIIPNMVDERIFSLAPPDPGKMIFFTLCGINEQKGIDHLLEAIALWNPPADRFEFRIGGQGPLRALYEAKAHALGLADRVHWLGTISREQVPAMFRNSHIFVMPSRHETFGVVFAEAIACGKPVIATRCGGPESIVNAGNGLLVDIGDVPALAQAMQTLAANWSKYSPQAIRQDFEQRFSRQAVVSQLRILYDDILRKQDKIYEITGDKIR
ncbi:glycosyltransferase [Leeia oryzae]|uniref:glycosyltransferase n=1 Tax=Leeia oryzae TaxID=356662 RepID=UPI0003743EF6|nr:glycosyltransferase [Leeia oryzae]